jgi:hypothetical protein
MHRVLLVSLEVDSLCSESFEGNASVLTRLERYVGNKRVPLLLSSRGILIPLPFQQNTDSGRNMTDALRPKMLIQTYSNPDIFGSHLLLGKSLDLPDGSGGSLLEGAEKLG